MNLDKQKLIKMFALLIGIVIVIIGFVMKFDTLAVVVVAGAGAAVFFFVS